MTEHATSLVFEAPVFTGKDRVRVAMVPMPATPDLKEGESNRCVVGFVYLKDGMQGRGRGYYLTILGEAVGEIFCRHMLLQDPSEYLLVEGAKRFSAKTWKNLMETAPEKMRAEIEVLLADARRYYAGKAA